MSSPEEAKLVDDEKVKCVKKPRFSFEWVEVNSDSNPESVTRSEYPEEECSVTKEVLHSDSEPLLTPELKEKNLNFTPESVTGAADPDSLDYHTFSAENPRFCTVIQPTHLQPKYSLAIPYRVADDLPQKRVPAVLISYGKSWSVFYNGHQKLRSFDRGWKLFADDNELKLGDACFFEILENSNTRIVFKIVLLRTALYACPGGDSTAESSNPCAGGDSTIEASNPGAGGNTVEEPIFIE